MSAGTYRGTVKGGTIVLHDNGAPLADGTEVLVTLLSARRPGNGAALAAAMDAAPKVPREWVDELEQLIAGRPTAPAEDSP